MSNKVVLAIDYGTVRIGLAISQHAFSQPLKIISNNESKFEEIKKICFEHDVKIILIGISENEMAKKTKKFARELKEIIKTWQHKPMIEFEDETLSSYMVHEKLKFAKKSKRNAHIDHYAAAEFLQEWLDRHY